MRSLILTLQRGILLLAQHWFLLANLTAVLYILPAFLAPALMNDGNEAAGRSLYAFYATQNHQLPQRSYFLFGESGSRLTYGLDAILDAGADPDDLEAFVGNEALGYKLALNGRTTAVYLAFLLGGWLWWVLGKRPNPTPVQIMLATLPIVLDGLSHVVSEGGSGFRRTNEWASAMFGDLFSAVFYTGTTIGTLNWLLRTGTAVLFGLVLVWFLYSRFDTYFLNIRTRLEARFSPK